MNRIGKKLMIVLVSICMITSMVHPYMTLASSENLQKSSVEIDSFIQSAMIEYQSEKEWIKIDDQTKNIPADARLKTTIHYDDIDAKMLIENGGTLTYKLPQLFKDSTVANNTIQDADHNTVGTISIDENTGTVKLKFEESFLQQDEDEHKKINGNFTFYSKADTEQIKKNPEQNVVIGNTTIHLNFEENGDARLGELNVLKTNPEYSEEGGKAYLTYTLIVSTGNDPMPDVKITDYFLQNEKYVDGYVGISGTQTATKHEENTDNIPYECGESAESYTSSVYLGNSNADKSKVPEPAGDHVNGTGTLVWDIGNMGSNQTRKLKYKVKLKDSYIGIQSRGTITNHAKAFSKSYEHKESSSEFTPSAGMYLKKTAGAYQADPSGNGGTITYTVYMKANKDNTYTLKNVKLYDNFMDYNTDKKLFPYMSYESDSFKLYEGSTAKEENLLEIPKNKHEGKSNPSIVSDGKSVCKFDFYVGDLKPGEERVVTYRVRVTEGIFALSNDEIKLRNRAAVYSDDTAEGGNVRFNGYNNEKSIGKKMWDRKLQSESMKESQTINIPQSDSVYNSSMNTISPSSRSFTILSGSYKYQVVVNETGDWDVSSSIFGDQLANNYLAYQGYLKIDYYESGLSTQPSTDKEAAEQLAKKEPSQTVWIDIHNQEKFSLSPKMFQQEHKKGAYLLTYYATPRNTEDVSQVSSGNSFTLGGTVIGPGGTSISMSGVRVETSVIIEGGNKFEAKKQGWYFDPTKTAGDWKNGSLYWVIEASGEEIPEGTVFRDEPDRTNAWNRHLLRKSSMVGVYIGKIPEGKDFREYFGTVNDLSNDAQLRKLSGNELNGGQLPSDSDYQWSATNTAADITLKKSIKLQQGEHLYIVLRTAPNRSISLRDGVRYDNELLTKDHNASDYVSQQKVSLWSAGGGNNFKEVAGVYERDTDGKWITKQSYNGNSYGKLLTNQIKDPGTYIEWRMKINYIGNLSGKVIVEDQIPEGLDFTYARYFWIHPSLRGNPPTTITIPECENGSWKKIELSSSLDGDRSGKKYNCIAYYNPETRKIRIAVDNLQRDGNKDERSLELQLVTKVTDSQVLLDGIQKGFVNAMTVMTESGNTISTSTATASIKKTSIQKTKQDVKDGKLPFTITVNELGEDLLKNGDQITLVDEMQKPLRFDPDSVQVRDKNGKVLTGISPKIETTNNGEKMSLTIPDNEKLTITYNATLNAAPDTDISVNNKAYWFGHRNDIAKIENETIRYHVESYAGSTTKPGLKVKKVDKDNTSKVLEGATFIIQKVTYNPLKKEWVAAQNAPIYKNTTDASGLATFGKNESLEYNTVYCLRETKAPLGYMLDSTPRYFAIAQKTGPKGQETYPADLKQWEDEGVDVYYLGATYQCTMYNSRGVVNIEKQFIDVKGNPITGKEIPNVTCSFAIYEDKGKNADYSKEKKLHILQITSNHGQISYKLDGVHTDKPQFSQLPVGGKFCIFELDQNGNPVTKSGTRYQSTDTIGFEVLYNGGWKSYVIRDDGTSENVEIINRYYTHIDTTVNTGVWNEHLWIYLCMIAVAILVAVPVIYRRIRRRY